MIKVRKIFNLSIIFAVRTFVFFKSRAIFYIRKETVTYVKPPVNDFTLEGNIAIVAMWQNSLCRNFKEMLETLKAAGIKTIAINNQSLDRKSTSDLINLVDVYVERKPGLGRDIACYKLGVEIANTIGINADNVQKVIFANDSVLYLKTRLRRLLDKIISLDDEVIGITESSELHYHISSWFFAIRKDVFCNKTFQDFWRGYKGYQSRRHSINKGEVYISRAFSRLGFSPRIIYDTYSIVSTLKSDGTMPIDILKNLPPFIKDRFIIKAKILNKKLFYEILESSSNNVNQTSYWSLILLEWFDFPFIKKESYSREVFGLSEIKRIFKTLVAQSPSERNSIEYILSQLVKNPQTSGESFTNKVLIKSGVK